MTASGRRGFVVILLPIVVLTGVLIFSLARDDGRPGAVTSTSESSSEPSFGEALGGGIFGDAVQIGCRGDGSGGTVSIPECIGAVERLGIVTSDLEHTIWSIEATEPGGVPVGDVRVGIVPDGFREVGALEGAQLDETMLVLVDGTQRRGAVRVATSGDRIPPEPCS